jgi:transposase InsO family protein
MWSNVVVAPSGVPVPGPAVRWKGRRHGPRKHRRWANAWSPEQIARRLPIDFPDDETLRISHEAIYQALFVQNRGALRREARLAVISYIEGWYNPARRHSGIAYLSPIAYEANMASADATT